MKARILILPLVIIFFVTGLLSVYSQDNLNSSVSTNNPRPSENQISTDQPQVNTEILSLEKKYKDAIESGNFDRANQFESQIDWIYSSGK